MIKNITLSAEDALLKKSRLKAQSENTTINSLFREWLMKYISRGLENDNINLIMDKYTYANSGKKFSREEMNER